jgi:hypothetical protein
VESENQSPPLARNVEIRTEPVPASAELFPTEEPDRGLRGIFIGSEGLRAGWSVLVFLLLFSPLVSVIMVAMLHFHLIDKTGELAPGSAFFNEAASLLALIIAAAFVGLIEGRRISAYNLTGLRRRQHFLAGLAAGFLALSALVGALAAGGWLHFGPAALSGVTVIRFGLVWGCVFLMTGCFEEGLFRCYLQFTLTRSINFWWAFGAIATICGILAVFVRGSASTGVYAAALLGFFPCLALYRKSAARSAFWYAAWVTSTLFGAIHISNARESGVGIFAAAFIGFVFCVSVRVTGSAWWAIGCHAGWDWAETFFYGTADSGLSPHGSYLTSHPAGNPFWSGGSVGPEGSALVLGAILLLLAVVLVYGRLSTQAQTASAALS